MNLIRYEWKKINAPRWLTAALCLLTFCGIILTFALVDQDESDWRSYAETHRAELQEMIAQTDPEDPQYEEFCAVFRKEIDQIDYCLENDLIYGCQSVWSYLYRARFLLGILTIAMILLAGNAVAVEHICKMHEKITSRKYTIIMLLRTKLCALWLLEFLTHLAGAAVLFLVGFLLFGHAGQITSAAYTDGMVVTQNLAGSAAIYFIVSLLAALIYIDLAVILETLFPNKKIVSVSVILLYLFNGTLVTISEKLGAVKILPFYYLDAARCADGLHTADFRFQAVYLICLFALLTALAFFAAKPRVHRDEQIPQAA